mmetsp:Transcript_19481/g.48839  ORF Transcript_19481/g.48839 Transcript_19481/m.48839 type:complete len:207 (-) Transcript_19481:340-960(-)
MASSCLNRSSFCFSVGSASNCRNSSSKRWRISMISRSCCSFLAAFRAARRACLAASRWMRSCISDCRRGLRTDTSLYQAGRSAAAARSSPSLVLCAAPVTDRRFSFPGVVCVRPCSEGVAASSRSLLLRDTNPADGRSRFDGVRIGVPSIWSLPGRGGVVCCGVPATATSCWSSCNMPVLPGRASPASAAAAARAALLSASPIVAS